MLPRCSEFEGRGTRIFLLNYSNPLDAVPDVSLETRLITTENQCEGNLFDRQHETSSVLNAPIQNFLFSQRFLRRNIRARVDRKDASPTNVEDYVGTTCNNTQFAREYDALALIELALIDSLVVYLSVDFHPLPTHPCSSLVASTTLRTRTQGQIKY